MKIIFFGTAEFSEIVLQSLIDNDLKPVLAVSQPDRPQGRKHEIVKTNVHALADKYDIPVYQPKSLKPAEVTEKLAKYEPDFLITAAYGNIIPDSVLDLAKIEALNVHASLLPKYRGASPVQATLINQDEVTGVSIMRMVSKLDAGPVFKQFKYEIPDLMRADELSLELARLAAKHLPTVLAEIAKGELEAKEQDEDKATYAGLLNKKMGKVKWKDSARAIEGLVRGLYPWPSAYSFEGKRRFKIHQAKAYKLEDLDFEIPEDKLAAADYGTVVALENKSIYVKTGEGILELIEIQKDNSRKMNTKEIYHNYESFEDKFSNEQVK